VKAQVRGCVSSLDLDRSEGVVGPHAINVPLACGGQRARWTVVVALVLGSLGVHMSVDGVRDGGVCAACLVLVDERSAFAVVAHPGHQVSQARTAGRCEGVAGVP